MRTDDWLAWFVVENLGSEWVKGQRDVAGRGMAERVGGGLEGRSVNTRGSRSMGERGRLERALMASYCGR